GRLHAPSCPIAGSADDLDQRHRRNTRQRQILRDQCNLRRPPVLPGVRPFGSVSGVLIAKRRGPRDALSCKASLVWCQAGLAFQLFFCERFNLSEILLRAVSVLGGASRPRSKQRGREARGGRRDACPTT